MWRLVKNHVLAWNQVDRLGVVEKEKGVEIEGEEGESVSFYLVALEFIYSAASSTATFLAAPFLGALAAAGAASVLTSSLERV